MHGCALYIIIIIGRKYENAELMSSCILSKWTHFERFKLLSDVLFCFVRDWQLCVIVHASISKVTSSKSDGLNW